MADPYRAAAPVEEPDPFVEPDPFPGSHRLLTAYDVHMVMRMPPQNWADWEHNARVRDAFLSAGYVPDETARWLLESACKPEWLER